MTLSKKKINEVSKLLSTKDQKTIEAYANLERKIDLLEEWRQNGLPEIMVNDDVVLYKNAPKNPNQLIVWNDGGFGLCRTSKSFFYRKVKSVGGISIDCLGLVKLRARAAEVLKFWNDKTTDRLKRNKELQKLRGEVKTFKALNGFLASQLSAHEEERKIIDKTMEILERKNKVAERRSSKLIKEVNALQKKLSAKNHGLQTV